MTSSTHPGSIHKSIEGRHGYVDGPKAPCRQSHKALDLLRNPVKVNPLKEPQVQHAHSRTRSLANERGWAHHLGRGPPPFAGNPGSCSDLQRSIRLQRLRSSSHQTESSPNQTPRIPVSMKQPAHFARPKPTRSTLQAKPKSLVDAPNCTERTGRSTCHGFDPPHENSIHDRQRPLVLPRALVVIVKHPSFSPSLPQPLRADSGQAARSRRDRSIPLESTPRPSARSWDVCALPGEGSYLLNPRPHVGIQSYPDLNPSVS